MNEATNALLSINNLLDLTTENMPMGEFRSAIANIVESGLADNYDDAPEYALCYVVGSSIVARDGTAAEMIEWLEPKSFWPIPSIRERQVKRLAEWMTAARIGERFEMNYSAYAMVIRTV